jgi:hypothetical protein
MPGGSPLKAADTLPRLMYVCVIQNMTTGATRTVRAARQRQLPH